MTSMAIPYQASEKRRYEEKVLMFSYQVRNLEKEKEQYNRALSYARKLLSTLHSGFQNLSSSQDNMKRYFTIGGKTADGGKIEKNKSELNSIIKKVNNTIIPAINAKINNITNEIKDKNNNIYYYKQKIREIERRMA